ncbi:hypothetical protein [Cohnella cellulosilytica]|uniref:Uncharacterized protein n=1 Tax=Cohnella cellulosilytica TaxID=986710 RepID=A0ABW2F8I6_9BACL
MEKRKVQAQLIITCDVVIDDDLKRKAVKQYASVKDDESLAKQLLYAYLNPKIPYNKELVEAEGSWDAICEFKGRLSNIKISDEII